MIAHLQGKLVSKTPTAAVVDVGGVGYGLSVSLTTYGSLPSPGEPVKLHTRLLIRDDQLALFGFGSVEELQLFELLIGVSGVGPRSAQTILSGLSPRELTAVIRDGRAAELTAVKGVGRKTAERVVLDLRDRLPAPEGSASDAETAVAAAADDVDEEAVLALMALGVAATAARQAVARAGKKHGPTASVQDLIRQALHER